MIQYNLVLHYHRIKKKNCKIYGEVNGGLRRNIKELKELLPNMRIIHIVRNGKETISSVLNRNTLLKGDAYYNLQPSCCIIDKKKWTHFTRFEKIAFLWDKSKYKYSKNNFKNKKQLIYNNLR